MAKKKTNVRKKSPARNTKSQEMKAAKRAAAKAERKLQHRKKILRITAISVASVAAVAAIAAGTVYLVDHSGVMLRTQTAVSTKHYSLSNAEYCYFYDQCYNNYLDSFEAVGEEPAFDPDKKRSHQQTDDGTTWHDFFLESTNSVVQDLLQHCEMAYDADYHLTEEQLATCAENAATLDMTTMPKGVRREDIQTAMELEMLGNSYYEQLINAIEITDEELQQGYEKNKAAYQTWDMLCYTIAWTEDADATAPSLKQEEAKQYAEELAACQSPAAFEEYVTHFLLNIKQKTADEAQQLVNAMALSTNGTSYSAAVSQWAMEESPALYDTYIYTEDGQNSYQVYMLTSLPTRNESDAVDFRIIVLPYASYTDADGARKQADALMKQWQQNGSDESAFSNLATMYTSDSSTFQNGGLVSAYSADRTTYGKEIIDWLYADGRKKGDTTIISADDAGNGAVLMVYFADDSPLTVWENQVKNDLYEAKLQTITDQQKLVLVSIHQEAQQKLDF